jgi:hypothetical protein
MNLVPAAPQAGSSGLMNLIRVPGLTNLVLEENQVHVSSPRPGDTPIT